MSTQKARRDTVVSGIFLPGFRSEEEMWYLQFNPRSLKIFHPSLKRQRSIFPPPEGTVETEGSGKPQAASSGRQATGSFIRKSLSARGIHSEFLLQNFYLPRVLTLQTQALCGPPHPARLLSQQPPSVVPGCLRVTLSRILPHNGLPSLAHFPTR